MPGRLDDYVQVHERLQNARDDLASVNTTQPIMLTEVMGYIQARVDLKDGRWATGTASFRLDLTGNRAQATNPIEDCETSAIGRALGILGYGVKGGIASREEVEEARRRTTDPMEHTLVVGASKRDVVVRRINHCLRQASEQGIELPMELVAYDDSAPVEQLIEIGKQIRAIMDKAEAR